MRFDSRSPRGLALRRRDIEFHDFAAADFCFDDRLIGAWSLKSASHFAGHAGSNRIRRPLHCISMRCKAVLPAPPLSMSGIQSWPARQNHLNRWLPKSVKLAVTSDCASSVSPRHAATIGSQAQQVLP